jgi:cell division protein FtsB
VLVIATVLAGYFAYHAVTGTHGLEARRTLTERARLLSVELAGLEATRASLEVDVGLLAREPADPDMVEEIARAVLGFSRPGDLVVPAPLGPLASSGGR